MLYTYSFVNNIYPALSQNYKKPHRLVWGEAFAQKI